MAGHNKPFTILMADDDPDDCLLVADALQETGREHRLMIVRNGEELVDYLQQKGEYAEDRESPRPELILLDLKMPRQDGSEALREIKSDPQLRRIPVVAFTTSTAPDDIRTTYDLGVNSYITKPVTFGGLVDTMETLMQYWFELVELPPRE